jgi:hypothetical protein
VRDKRDPSAGRVVEGEQRHAEERTHRRAQRLGPRCIGGTLRESDESRTERSGRTDERAQVARIADPPERKTDLRHRCARQILASEDADHTRRMAQRGDLGQQGRLHVLFGDEHLDRLNPGVERRLHEVLALRNEEPKLFAPAAVVQLANELELLVLARGDQAASEPSADLAQRRRFATLTIEVAWALPAQPSNAPCGFMQRSARAPISPFPRSRRRPADR